MLCQILRRNPPVTFLVKNHTHTLLNHLRFGTTEHVAAALNRLRSLCHIPDSHIGDTEDAALLLNSAAVAENTEGITFQCDEIEEAEWGEEFYLLALNIY